MKQRSKFNNGDNVYLGVRMCVFSSDRPMDF